MTDDPGVASERFATIPTLAGITIAEGRRDGALDAITTAFTGVRFCRHSGRWTMETFDTETNARIFATARASIAAWADDEDGDAFSGLLVHVGGDGIHQLEGHLGVPGNLHTYLLCVTRKADGTDAMDTVGRVVLSCPRPDWCRRGGCPADAGENETGVMAAMITEYADAAMAAQHHHRWPSQTYNALYGPGAGTDDSGEHVVDYCETASTAAGWTVIGKSQAAGGMEELLLRRDQRFIALSYDPLTRQIQLADGQPGIEELVDLMTCDGVITGNDQEVIDASEDLAKGWNLEALIAANDYLRGRLADRPQLAEPVQGTLLGLHPHGDGMLRAPRSEALCETQLAAMLTSIAIPQTV